MAFQCNLVGGKAHTARHRSGPCSPERSHACFCEGTRTASVCVLVQLSLCQGHQASPRFDARRPPRSRPQLPPGLGALGSGVERNRWGDSEHQLLPCVLLVAWGRGHFPWGWASGPGGHRTSTQGWVHHRPPPHLTPACRGPVGLRLPTRRGRRPALFPRTPRTCVW